MRSPPAATKHAEIKDTMGESEIHYTGEGETIMKGSKMRVGLGF